MKLIILLLAATFSLQATAQDTATAEHFYMNFPAVRYAMRNIKNIDEITVGERSGNDGRTMHVTYLYGHTTTTVENGRGVMTTPIKGHYFLEGVNKIDTVSKDVIFATAFNPAPGIDKYVYILMANSVVSKTFFEDGKVLRRVCAK
jgi:hypothetical protein